MNNVRISIITVCFNARNTIAQTINSVIRQSIQPFEYIIIDGGSVDGTVELINNYVDKHNWIRVISEKDDGIYDAMNKGILLAKGHLIGIVNSDDWYEENALEVVTNSFLINGPGVYYGLQRYIKNEEEYFIERTNIKYIGQKMIQHPTCFVSKNIYNSFGLFNVNYKYSSDLEFMIRLMLNKVSFIQLNNIITNFRIGGASSSRSAAIESLKIRYLFGLINKREFTNKYIKLFIQNILKV